MKKVFIMTILALAGAMAYAGPVSKEKALQVASKVFAAQPATKAAGPDKLTVVWDGEFEKTKGATNPAFYVVTREKGGFVIVAGNDNVQPVLGFSFENPFKVEGMPENVRYWMEQLKKQCRSVSPATLEIRRRWSAFEDTKAASPIDSGFTDEYLGSRTNEWDQTNPANYYCPDVAGQSYTAVCGCVPLATSLIMAWFGTANKSSASGTVAGYTYNSANGQTVEIPSHELGTEYNWAALKALASSHDFYSQINEYTGSFSTLEQIFQTYYTGAAKGYVTLTPLGENLAHLVYDIGTLLQVKYNDTNYAGTGGVASYIPMRVGPVMGYNNTARLVSKINYPDAQWEALLKEQIFQHPVLYSGRTEDDAGHSYVADGFASYGDDLVFHFNLGWGGSCNGYYYTGVQDEFDRNHSALVDFYPNPSSSHLLPMMGYGNNGGMQYSSGYNTGTLNFSITNFYNLGSASFSGNIYAGISNADNSVSSYVSIISVDGLPVNSGWTSYPGHSVTSPSPALGQGIQLYYKEASGATYYPFYAPNSLSGLTSLPFFPAAFIKTEASYSVGDYFVFQLTNHNYQYHTATWTVTTPGGTSTDYTMDDYHVRLSAAGEYKITVSIPDKEKITTFITVN